MGQIQGLALLKTFVALNSRLESNEEEEGPAKPSVDEPMNCDSESPSGAVDI